MNQKMIDVYNYIKANGPCSGSQALEALGIGHRSGAIFAYLSQKNYIIFVKRFKGLSVWKVNPDMPAPTLPAPKPVKTKKVEQAPPPEFKEQDTSQPTAYRFRYGQVVVTPAGRGVVTSQQGDRVVVKLKDCRRQAFPLSQCNVA